MTQHSNSVPYSPSHMLVCKWQPELVTALASLGVAVVMVLDRADRDSARKDPAWSLCRYHYDISSFDSLEEVAAVAADLQLNEIAVDQVISHQEVTQHGAGYLESLLQLSGDPLHRLRLRDKRLMKQWLSAVGIPVARFASVKSPDDEPGLQAAAAMLRPPYIAKPAAGFGTMSTLRLEARSDLLNLGQQLRIDPQIRSRQMIIEEFVPGDELQIEMFWSAGRLVEFVVFKYHLQRVRMMPLRRSHRDGVRLVLPEEDPETYAAIRRMAESAGRRMGITDGTSQIEAFLDADGTLTLSEIAARGGGAWTPALLREYLGYPVWDLIARCHRHLQPRSPLRTHKYLASLSIRPDTTGRVAAFPSGDHYAALPGVLRWQNMRNVGDKARLHHPSDYYVHVIIGADTLEELELRCQTAQQQLVVRVEPDPVQA